MAGGKMRVAAGIGLQQCRIFRHDLVGAFVMTDPEFVCVLGLPGDRVTSSIDFMATVILMAGKHLSCREDTAHPIGKAKQNRGEIFLLH